jgi:SAM-dependent methyltransferase
MPKTEPFEHNCDAYDDWFEKNRDAFAAELETIRRLIPRPGASGLEVGVGSGQFAAPLGISIGIEPSPQMAIRARRRGIRVCPGVAEALPFLNTTFEFVLMVTTICFLDDVARAIDEAYRVLKPGGYLIVGFIDKESELGGQYVKNREKSIFYKDAAFFSVPEVMFFLKHAGFSNLITLQTLIPGEPPSTLREGSGRGAFVGIRGLK